MDIDHGHGSLDGLLIPDETAETVYHESVTMVSEKERLAYQRLTQWRKACYATIALACGLVGALVLLISQQQHHYTLAGITEEGKVRLEPLTDRPWSLDERHIRDQIRRWLVSCRGFGTDERALAHARLFCEGMAYKQAQTWARAHFEALPLKEVRKVAISIDQPPLPAMRFVPPSAGRTWEVYWQEEWSVTKNTVAQRKAFLALVTIYIREPRSDEEARGHLGVWIEHISVEERPVDVARGGESRRTPGL